MLKKTFLLIILTILLPGSLSAWDPASHIYLSLNMKEIWQDFDPEFYNALASPFYGGGTTDEELEDFCEA